MTKSERQATLFQELQPGPSQDFVEWYRWTPDYLLEPPGPPCPRHEPRRGRKSRHRPGPGHPPQSPARCGSLCLGGRQSGPPGVGRQPGCSPRKAACPGRGPWSQLDGDCSLLQPRACDGSVPGLPPGVQGVATAHGSLRLRSRLCRGRPASGNHSAHQNVAPVVHDRRSTGGGRVGQEAAGPG